MSTHTQVILVIPADAHMASLDAFWRAVGQLGLAVHPIAPGKILAAPLGWEPERETRDPAARIRRARLIAEQTLH